MAAEDPGFLVDARERSERRDRVLSELGAGVAIVGAAPTYIRNHDVEHSYRQDSDFHYLSGLAEPESVLLLTNRHKEHRFVLFVRPRDPERETWDGPRVGVEGARESFGADAAFPIGELAQRLPEYLADAPRLMYALGRNPTLDAVVLGAIAQVKRRQRLGVLGPTAIIDPLAVLHPLRWQKSKGELDALSRALAATAEGHAAAMRIARAGRFEYEVEAELVSAFRRHGCERVAYEPIVGSGPNATILHYRSNDRRMESGDLLLIDAGAEWGYQSADVTRTFPIDGTFSPAQRAVYEVVLSAQMAAIRATRPGTTLEDVHRIALEVLTEGMIELGLIAGPLEQALAEERYKPFYMHRSSHWLGMDVHDVGAYFERDVEGESIKPKKLEPGCVLTIEPGLYVSARAEVEERWKGIGIRIEDDILVTDEGCRILSEAIPKRIEDLETILAAR